jgi:glycosyltransferase involved in cell wall biosynthesis
MRSYASKFPEKIKYFRLNENVGFSEAVKKFLHCANGEIFYFVGDDDILKPDLLASVVKEFDTNPELGLVYTNYWMMILRDGAVASHRLQYPSHYDGVHHRKMTPVEFVRRMIGGKGAVASHSAFVKRSVYEAVGGWSSEYAIIHDQDLWFRVATGYEVQYLPAPLMTARKFNQHITAAYLEEGFEALSRYWDAVYRKTDDRHLQRAIREYFCYLELRSITFYLGCAFHHAFFQRHARRLWHYADFWKRPRLYAIPLISFLPQRMLLILLRLADR